MQNGIAKKTPEKFSFQRKTLVVMLGLALTQTVLAQENIQTLETVVVTGQAASLDSALDMQQMADDIISVVHADAIGQLPDANAAEALQRIPGLSVERDQGEGRYVRVRGLGPDLNAVTINGSLVPAPESDRRAVALDVLPAGLIRSLEVKKTMTPDTDANSLGGTIEVKTISGLDHKGMFYSLEGGVSHDTNIDKTSPNFAAAWSNQSDDGKLGIAFGLSSQKRQFGSDNSETGGDWDGELLEKFQRRDYVITRERQGAAFNIDYRPQAGESYYLRTLFSRFSDDEIRQRNNIKFDDALAAGALGDTESSRELKARKETQDIHSVVLGTERRFGPWKLALAAGTSSAQEKTPQYISSAKFVSGTTYTSGFNNGNRPELIDSSSINTTSDYELDSISLSEQMTKDSEHNVRFDLGRHFDLLGGTNELKLGGKISRRKKTNELTAWEIDGGDFGNPSMSGFTSGSVDYAYGNYGSGLSKSALISFLNGVDKSAYFDEEESRINDFTMHEDINAAYLQNTYSLGLWRVLLGMRYEGTQFKASGTGLNNGVFVATEASNRYHNWLPAIHLRRDLDNDTTVRAAWSNSVVRPTFGQLTPGYVIDDDEAKFGNPLLKPMKSTNFDLGIEKRLGYAGAISAYVFHKNIRDFVYRTDVAGTGAWINFDEANTFANGDKARISGLELAFTQSLSFLPAPWDGLLISTNATFSDAKAKIAGQSGGAAVTRDIPLPSQSKSTFNLMLGYESGPINLRLAATHKSRYLLEVADLGDAAQDQYVDGQTHYDFSARYQLSKQVQVIFEALNLSNEKYYVYAGNQTRNVQYESYGRTLKLGLKITSF